MPKFRIFLGAPLLGDLDNNPRDYNWQTVSSQSQSDKICEQFHTPPDFPAIESLEEASRRISLIYQNVIFNNDREEQEESFEGLGDDNHTTVITWPPTQEEQDHSRSRGSLDKLSFLNTTTRSSAGSLSESQDTQPETQSVNYSDASSIARLPTFHLNLHALVSITQLVKQKVTGTIKLSTLLAVLETEGPDGVRLKTGRDVGKEVAILKMILGDEGGTICKLTAWREVAERWGGQQNDIAIRRGDIILIENVTATFDSKSSPTITASPFLKSSLTICYRTMPYTKSDGRLRPDLRLGRSDAAVRRVASIVTWFEELAGLNSTGRS